jgi:hypothetical protein
MNVRLKKTGKRTAEADEDIGTARLVVRARRVIAAGAPLIPKRVADRIANGEMSLRALRKLRDIAERD